MAKVLSFVIFISFFVSSAFAQSIDFRVIEDKLSSFDVEANASSVSASLFAGVDSVQLAKDLETIPKFEKLKSIAARLSAKIKKGNYVTLGEVEIASQDGVQLAGPMFLNSTNSLSRWTSIVIL